MKFTKMQGCGNDYVYIDCFRERVENPGELAKRVSDRHFGIGSDGLILICPSETSDFRMDMYNADGSRGSMCGNGIRCVGKYVYEHGLTDKTDILIETLAGEKNLNLNVKDGKVDTVRVDMGIPTAAHLNLCALDRSFELTAVDMGNPHAVTMVYNVDEYEIEKYGSVLETDKAFPDRANIEFVEMIDRTHIRMRVWERGSGETWACGTGACASAYACMVNGLTEHKTEVSMLGGRLTISYNPENRRIYMTGTATEVFCGEFFN